MDPSAQEEKTEEVYHSDNEENQSESVQVATNEIKYAGHKNEEPEKGNRDKEPRKYSRKTA
jgi:hypothetical protein